jgi:cell division septation protein DedD/nucleoid DNA-binding protein
MLDEYIKELIANNNRVIIPNFGAFLLRATSKNKNKKELSEKIDDIYFSPFLKFNDELLVNHIIKKEGGDTQGAMDKINGYIRNIEEKVEKDGSYTIDGLGEFHMDDQGKVQFKVYSSAEASESTKTTKSSTKKESAPSSKTVNEKAAREPKSSPGEEQAAKASSKPEPERKETQARASGTARSAGNSKTKTSGAKTTPPPSSGSKQTTKKPAKGTNRGLVLSIAVGVPIAILFIWAMLNFDTVQELFKNDKGRNPQAKTTQEEPVKPKKEKSDSKQTTQKQQTKDASQKQTASDKTTEQSKPQKEVRQQASRPANTKKYYIVAGSFKKRENAVNFRDKLLKQGYDAEMIGERNGMHAVSYASFQNKSQAQAELRNLRNQEGLSAWLLYY